MALSCGNTSCGVAEALRVRDLRGHWHHSQGPTSVCCWPRQRCRSELARKPELIGNIQQWHPGVRPLFCFPGPTGDGVALTKGRTADLAQPPRLNRCSHAHHIFIGDLHDHYNSKNRACERRKHDCHYRQQLASKGRYVETYPIPIILDAYQSIPRITGEQADNFALPLPIGTLQAGRLKSLYDSDG